MAGYRSGRPIDARRCGVAAAKKLTEEVIAAFLAQLRACGKIEQAANAVGVTKGTVYAHAARHAEFKAAMEVARREGRSKPKTSAELQREAYMAILASPEASERAKLDAGDQLRKLDAEERRQRRELGGGDTPAEEPEASPEISPETAAVLRLASIRAKIATLTQTIYTPALKWSYDEWVDFAGWDRADQEATLEEARNPKPLTATVARPPGDDLDELLRPQQMPAPAPAVVTEGIERILAGEDVERVVADLRQRMGPIRRHSSNRNSPRFLRR
jgi:hypothetical protein